MYCKNVIYVDPSVRYALCLASSGKARQNLYYDQRFLQMSVQQKRYLCSSVRYALSSAWPALRQSKAERELWLKFLQTSVLQKRYLCKPLSTLCPLLGQLWQSKAELVVVQCMSWIMMRTYMHHTFILCSHSQGSTQPLPRHIQYCTLVVFSNLSVILTNCSVLYI